MKRLYLVFTFIILGGGIAGLGFPVFPEPITIDHACTDLSLIPDHWINQAKIGLHVVYQHTSHGSQLITGMNTLAGFSDFGAKYQWTDDGSAGLDLDDYGISGCSDLSQGDFIDANGVTPWVSATRTLLNNTDNYHINVVVWSWCSINMHNAQRYLDNMEILIAEYGEGGTAPRAALAPVKFVFMTGHAEGQGENLYEDPDESGDGHVHYNNQLIREHCSTNNRVLFDFADIEAYDPDGNYFWDLNMTDALYYTGGNWGEEWIDANPDSELGLLTMECSSCAHCDGPDNKARINCVLKGRAAWWLWARLAGWGGFSGTPTPTPDLIISPTPTSTPLHITPTKSPTCLPCMVEAQGEVYNHITSAPIENAYVELTGSDSQYGWFGFDFTDSDGEYNITGGPCCGWGDGLIQASAWGYQTEITEIDFCCLNVEDFYLNPLETPTLSPIPTSTPTPPVAIVFYLENLNSDPGWSTEADWSFGVPTGQGGSITPPPTPVGGSDGNPDPAGGYTGDNVYGYNLNGNYTNNISQTYYLTTNQIDCSGFEQVKLYFQRWLNVERREHDCAYIQISSDGVNWIELWKNDWNLPNTTDSEWTRFTCALSPIADHQPEIRIRWGLGPTDTIQVFSGWNIDDIEVWGIPVILPTPTSRLVTPTPSLSPTPSLTPSPTVTAPISPTPTFTPPPSPTPSPSPTITNAPTLTPVPTLTPGVPVLIYTFPLNQDPGWTTEKGWSFGIPSGQGGVQPTPSNDRGNPDPCSGHTGVNVYGYNLNGNYTSEMPAYYLTSKVINCSFLIKTHLKFWRWLNVERYIYDQAVIQVSNDGEAWVTIWQNSDSFWTIDSNWRQWEYDISAIADGQPTVYIRWGMGPTNLWNNYSGWNIDDVEIWAVRTGITPLPTPTPLFSPSPSATPSPYHLRRNDFNGDGTADIAIFRPSSGLWAIRSLSRIYFGGSEDIPVPGDYDGDGTSDPCLFRGAIGLWAIRAFTRIYFGGSTDQPVPANYTGGRNMNIAVFRPQTGLWAIRDFTRIYFGNHADTVLAMDMDADGCDDPTIFRAATGLWAIRLITRFYFGNEDDIPLAAHYREQHYDTPGIFRPVSGLWALRKITRLYFGSIDDEPIPADYSGSGISQLGIFRKTSGLWAIRGLSRLYYGTPGDEPVSKE